MTTTEENTSSKNPPKFKTVCPILKVTRSKAASKVGMTPKAHNKETSQAPVVSIRCARAGMDKRLNTITCTIKISRSKAKQPNSSVIKW